MIIDHSREKLLNAIVYFLQNTKYCGKTKLFKLLYYLDFLHFKETGKSITGLDYFAWNYGPVPKDLYDEISKKPKPDLTQTIVIPPRNKSNNAFTEIKAKIKFDNTYFTKRELRILEQVAFIFKDAMADSMVDSSHLPNHPWDITIKSKGLQQKIDYFLALDNSENSLSTEEVHDRIADRKEVEKIFSE
ncbi:MAG: SocA family protein [Candidatus Magnetoovum sp. WYHC-5]|nr:SocA family protein [Candidatus Magnetoovum sp. WYHC-5]